MKICSKKGLSVYALSHAENTAVGEKRQIKLRAHYVMKTISVVWYRVVTGRKLNEAVTKCPAHSKVSQWQQPGWRQLAVWQTDVAQLSQISFDYSSSVSTSSFCLSSRSSGGEQFPPETSAWLLPVLSTDRRRWSSSLQKSSRCLVTRQEHLPVSSPTEGHKNGVGSESPTKAHCSSHLEDTG